MTRNALIFATAAALAIPAVASAEPKPDSSTASQATTATRQAPRYCVVDTPTGSNIERRTCKQLEDWLAVGFDPRVKK